MRRRFPFALAPLLVCGLFGLACGSAGDGDPPSTKGANPLGPGSRVREVADPKANKNGSEVSVTGAVTLFVDNFDETRDGKSRGTIYVQDVGSQEPYSGISLFSPAFIPADLRLAPGDVLDYFGQYVELKNIGTAVFDVGKVLPQLARPTGTFRYEYKTPEPRVIDIADLDDYDKGRRWMNMLVTVKDITIPDGLFDDGKGRSSAHLTNDITNRNAPTVTNELFDLQAPTIKAKTTYKSITGIVTWFFYFHIAPRSPADIVPE
ncbi:MAG: hypothetical protein JWM74_5111 [Myxococcaceae bacterium]|nr:hypothetical protein [Myxococcaceae bacterium]